MMAHRRRLVFVAMVWSFGCGKWATKASSQPVGSQDTELGEPATADTGPPPDADGDGWPSTEDCDDTDPSIHPGATESCNGVDQDCDGAVDNDAVDAAAWYADTDGDGYGSATSTTVACTAPKGWASKAGDCDDADAAIHPGATEICDGVDNDCDGSVDDDATDAAVWYADTDGDGYGSATDAMGTCERPSGYVDDKRDCDDKDPDVHPLAYDLCNDGVDQDCDGVDKSCPYSGVTSALSAADATLVGVGASDMTGEINGVRIVPDMDGDGYDELLIGAMYASTGAVKGGAAYLVYGPPSPGQTLLEDADATFFDEAAYAFAGSVVAPLGDITGDGMPDFGVGAAYADGAGDMSGTFYVFQGGSYDGTASLSTATTSIDGTGADEQFGANAVGVGDIDGDGIGDMAVSAPHHAALNGAVHVFLGPVPGGTGSASDADVTILGTSASDGLGADLAKAGDVDGDGHADLLVAGYAIDELRGRAYLFTDLARSSGDTIEAIDAMASFEGENPSDEAADVSGPSDIDGNGRPDVIIGAYEYGHSGFLGAYGRVYGFLAPIGSGSHADADADIIITGDAREDGLGHFTAAPGDINGDGADDLLVGGYGLGYQGFASVFFGPLFAGTELGGSVGATFYEDPGDGFGDPGGVGGGGDADGDGYPDFLVAAPFASDSAADSGTVYFFRGGP